MIAEFPNAVVTRSFISYPFSVSSMDNHADYRSYVVGIFLTLVVGIFYSWYAFPEGWFCPCFLDKIISSLIIALITKNTEKTLIFSYIFYVSSDLFQRSIWDESLIFMLIMGYPAILLLSGIFCWGFLTEEFFSEEERTDKRSKSYRASKKLKSILYSKKQFKKKYKIFLGILLLSIFFIAIIFIIDGSKGSYISSSSFSDLILMIWDFLCQFKLQIGFIVYILDVTYNIWAYLEARKKGLQIPCIKIILLILGSFPLFINLLSPKKP